MAAGETASQRLCHCIQHGNSPLIGQGPIFQGATPIDSKRAYSNGDGRHHPRESNQGGGGGDTFLTFGSSWLNTIGSCCTGS